MMKTALLAQVALLASLGPYVLSRPTGGGNDRALARRAEAQTAVAPTRSGPSGAAPLPTAVIAGFGDTAAHGYLDHKGTYHSALLPYTVRSHWQPGVEGGPAPTASNDRFTKVGDQRYIDVLATPNPQHLDTAQANRRMWGILDQSSLQLHVLGRARALGTWVPLVGVTNLQTGRPNVWLVFASPQHVWMLSLSTGMWTWPLDIPELTYVATTFRLAPDPTSALAAPARG